MDYCDLHVHTTASDGSETPTAVVERAKRLGLSAIAVTDHDTCDGVAEALSAGKTQGLEVIPGIEVSVDYQGHGIHILGYFVDPSSTAFERLLEWVIVERKRRNHEIADAMRADGIPIYPEHLKEKYPASVVGRPHFAAELVELGYAESVKDAFTRYLNKGQKYYRKRRYIPLQEGLQIIRDAGGKPVFAHPYQYKMDDAGMLTLATLLRDAGAVGIECAYTGYTEAQKAHIRDIAASLGLCLTGGSDFHGVRKPDIELGNSMVPYAYLETLKAI